MTTLKGVFPDLKPTTKRNFIHENVKNLRRMEHCFHINSEPAGFQKLQPHKHQKSTNKYHSVTAKVYANRSEKMSADSASTHLTSKKQHDTLQPRSKGSTPILSKKNITKQSNKQRTEGCSLKNIPQQAIQPKISSDPNIHDKKENDNTNVIAYENTKYKSQGIQTYDEKDINNLYKEGVIRYPTKRDEKPSETGKGVSNHHTEIILKEHRSPLSDRGDAEDAEVALKNLELHAENLNSAKPNKERITAACRLAAQFNNAAPPANYRKGVVPKYDIKSTCEIEKKHKKENKKRKQRRCTLTVQRVTSPYLTMNVKRPCVC